MIVTRHVRNPTRARAMRRTMAALGLALLTACAGPAGEDAAGPATASVVASATAAAPASIAPAAAAAVPAPKPDHPTLALKTFDGAAWNLADHRGHWVVVNFWATWCTPCLKEIPDLAAFDARRKDVDVIGLAYEEIEHADMVAFLKTHSIPYPVAVLDVYAPPPDFETPHGLPMTYVIAPDGKVARTFLGPLDMAELAHVIDAVPPAPPAPSAGA